MKLFLLMLVSTLVVLSSPEPTEDEVPVVYPYDPSPDPCKGSLQQFLHKVTQHIKVPEADLIKAHTEHYIDTIIQAISDENKVSYCLLQSSVEKVSIAPEIKKAFNDHIKDPLKNTFDAAYGGLSNFGVFIKNQTYSILGY